MLLQTELVHRRHSIKTMRTTIGFKARAFRGRTTVGDEFSGQTLEAAVLAVKGFLDEMAAAQRSRRGPNGFPCADEVRTALSQVTMSEAQEAMLLAHLHAPDHILTATELAHAAGRHDNSFANSQYGKLAHSIADELDWRPKEKNHDGTTNWTFTLADDADKQARKNGLLVPDQWRWELRPELIEALC